MASLLTYLSFVLFVSPNSSKNGYFNILRHHTTKQKKQELFGYMVRFESWDRKYIRKTWTFPGGSGKSMWKPSKNRERGSAKESRADLRSCLNPKTEF